MIFRQPASSKLDLTDLRMVALCSPDYPRSTQESSVAEPAPTSNLPPLHKTRSIRSMRGGTVKDYAPMWCVSVPTWPTSLQSATAVPVGFVPKLVYQPLELMARLRYH